jgi:ABC-type multidrug transport system ATPase subunit
MHRPSVLFLDEPTTGLDPEARAAMWDELSRLASGDKLTILLTTHYLEEADRLAERVAIVSRGQIVVEGKPEALRRELRGDAVTVELEDGKGPRLRRRAGRCRDGRAALARRRLSPLHGPRLPQRGRVSRVTTAASHTFYLFVRVMRNLARQSRS